VSPRAAAPALDAVAVGRRARSPLAWAVGLGGLLLVLIGVSVCSGSAGRYSVGETLRGLLAVAGLGAPLPAPGQTIVELRLYRTVVSAGVGSALALSGALLQGVFRNGLASPSIIGVSSGASLGAALAILTLGGYGPLFLLERVSGAAPFFVTAGAFAGASGVTFLVLALSTTGGRISVPTLLLVGIAVNAMVGGVLAAVQSSVLMDFEVARAVFAWGFGTLDDRSLTHAVLVLAGLAAAASVTPFVAIELDLFAGGEDDARALGVHAGRVKALALGAAALAAAVAVAVAGQVAFVGLIVPHMLRLVVHRSHRVLLPLSLLGGAVFLLGTDVLQRWILGDAYLRPGVVMSLLGGPFFLFLLVKNRAGIESW